MGASPAESHNALGMLQRSNPMDLFEVMNADLGSQFTARQSFPTL